MFSPIPLPYRILAAMLALSALFGSGVYAGHHWASVAADAARVRQAEADAAQLDLQRQRADRLAQQLTAAEGKIVVKTVEVIKNVPSVTTGRLCLGADAVGLLQPGAAWGPYQSTGEPAGESPAHAAASDRDVGYWIAEANRQYETCATRINALVDWFDSRNR